MKEGQLLAQVVKNLILPLIDADTSNFYIIQYLNKKFDKKLIIKEDILSRL